MLDNVRIYIFLYMTVVLIAAGICAELQNVDEFWDVPGWLWMIAALAFPATIFLGIVMGFIFEMMKIGRWIGKTIVEFIKGEK